MNYTNSTLYIENVEHGGESIVTRNKYSTTELLLHAKQV